MSRETSLYLDTVRVIAALAVLVDHLSEMRLTGGLFWQLTHFGVEAIMVFFVLSGFVIAYVTDTREKTARQYVISRATRIYSVCLPALLVTFVLHTIGAAFRPDFYPDYWNTGIDARLWELFCGLTFTNELWWSHVPILSNVPYWSLGYEVWYYVIFGLAVFAPAPWRWPAIITVLVFLGPPIVEALPIWLLGVVIWRRTASHRPGPWLGGLLWAGSLVAWLAYEIATRNGPLINEATRPGDHFLLHEAYIVAILFAVNLFGFQGISGYFRPVLTFCSSAIRWCAGATFSIYLMHYPFALFLGAITAWPPASWQTRLLVHGGTLLGVFVFAAATERRKDEWRRGISLLVDRLAPVTRL